MTRPLLVLSLVSFACVPQAQYDSVLKDLSDARSGCTDAEQARQAAEARAAELEAQLQSELNATKEELDELRRQREEIDRQFKELTAALQSLIDAGDLEVYMRHGMIMIGLSSQVLFPSGKAELSPRGQKALAQVATVIAGLPDRRLQVAGHTDNEPIGEKLKLEWVDNWDLSAARALTVTRFLVSKGVKPEALSAAGYGEFDPVGPNDSANGRKKNRRIELALIPDLSAIGKAAGATPAS